MNKNMAFILMAIGLVMVTHSAYGQTPATNVQMTLYQSAHYQVDADSVLPSGDVERVVYYLEANYTLFSEMFETIEQRPEGLLNVDFMGSKAAFDEVLSKQKIYNRHNFIYMYYGEKEKNILIIYPIEDAKENVSQLARHSFFSYAFDSLPTMPTWLREGMALYYASVIYDENDHAIVPYNRLYLDDLKRVAKESSLSLNDLMSLNDKPGNFENAQFERNLLYSWGLVNYLMFSENVAHPQLLKSALAQVSKDRTQEENSTAVMNYILQQYPDIQGDFDVFLGSQMGYIESLNAMREAHMKKEYENAKGFAEKARSIRQDAYLPVYYLGLIAFETQNYDEAQKCYQDALALGAPEALIDFAMGYVLYYGQRNFAEATASFEQAKRKDPDKFGQRVDAVMKNLTKDSDSPYRAPADEGTKAATSTTDSTAESTGTTTPTPEGSSPTTTTPAETGTTAPAPVTQGATSTASGTSATPASYVIN